jgi:DNA invertase Pin-like site-specific DNA recombinase
MQAITYARKSTLDRKREGKSVSDQLTEAAEECDRRGWTIVESLKDEIGASRHSRTKSRPGFERMVELVERGGIDAIVCAEQSRLSRRLSEIGELMELAADAGVLLVLGRRDVDLDDPMAWMLGGVQAGHDASVSEETRKRVLRGMRHAALAGRPGGRPAFGYSRIYDPRTGALQRVEVNAEEAAVIRSWVDGLLAGKSLRSTAKGSGRTPESVRRMVCSPLYTGQRVHQGKVVGPGVWEAIITTDEREALLSRFGGGERPARLRYLLSGLATCGWCDSKLRVNTRKSGRKVYICTKCLRISITVNDVDQYVTEAVLARLSDPRNLAAIAAAGGEEHAAIREQLAGLRERQREIGDAIAAGELSVIAGAAADRAISSQISSLENRAVPRSAPPGLQALLEGNTREAWDALDLEQRSILLRALVKIKVGQSTRPRGSRGFESARVGITWL